jgi:hypothetical protein
MVAEDWRPSYGARLTILLVCAFIGAGTNLFIAASHKIEDAQGVKYMFISVSGQVETFGC